MEANPDRHREERLDVAVELDGERRGVAVLGELGGVWRAEGDSPWRGFLGRWRCRSTEGEQRRTQFVGEECEFSLAQEMSQDA